VVILGFPDHVDQWLSNLEWLAYFNHIVQSYSITWSFWHPSLDPHLNIIPPLQYRCPNYWCVGLRHVLYINTGMDKGARNAIRANTVPITRSHPARLIPSRYPPNTLSIPVRLARGPSPRGARGSWPGLFFHKVPNMSRDMFIKKKHFQWTGS
jgi:hypothetical protein